MKIIKSVILLCAHFSLGAQVWQPLSTGLSGMSTEFGRCFTVYNSKLIVGGDFSSAGGNLADNIAAWDGSNWSVFGTGLQATSNSIGKGVYALTVHNNQLYAAGSFTASSTTTLCNLAKWNGSSWIAIGNSVVDSFPYPSRIKALCSFSNELYVGGTFLRLDGVTVNHIAKWNGSNWIPLGTGMSRLVGGNGYIDGVVNAITVYNNEIYAAGNFTNAGGVTVQNIAKWNGSGWSAVGTGIPSSGLDYGVTSLQVYNNELYAGNRVSGISKWNGSTWTTVGGGVSTSGGVNGVLSMCVHSGKLIAGGNFITSGLLNTFAISAWDGTSWNHIGGCVGFSGLDNDVKGVQSYNSCLHATGALTTSNDCPQSTNLNHIASFCGTIGIKEYSLNHPLKIHPNPSTGVYNVSGDKNSTIIFIYDLKGYEVYRAIATGESIRIDISAMLSGLYMIKVINSTGEVRTGRLIKE